MNHQPELRGTNIAIGQDVEFGINVVIYPNVKIENGCTIEDHCIIGHPAMVDSGWTKIDSYCTIRSHTVIYSGVSIGSSSSTGHHVCIREKSIIGKGCSIGSYSDLQGNLKMGDYCRLHSDVHLCQGSTLKDFVFIYPRVTLTNDPYPPSLVTEGPTIGSYTQICTGTTVLPGITIGENCLIGAGSLVTNDIPNHVLAFGHPARLQGEISELLGENKPNYPWMYRFDRNMPWEGQNFDVWLKDQK
ncbi:MAG: acetyltransferase-like isoleucine patch superfamily enzyme [Bacteroidia bacterium]|jgi:acetyltransferase-like isoleucine patch superfamily enzyme